MKKKTKVTLLIVLVVILALIAYGWVKLVNHWNTSQEVLCNKAENTGWAPVGPIEFAPIGCDGQRLKVDSHLIDRSSDKSGYTCYCHESNTCWDGEKCVDLLQK